MGWWGREEQPKRPILIQKIYDHKWCDGRGEGQGLREKQTGRSCPDFVFRGKFVEKCIERPTEAKGVPILPARKDKLFQGMTEGDGWRERIEKGTSLTLLLVWVACIGGGAVEGFQGFNGGSWFSIMLPSRFHTSFSALFVILWICPSFRNLGGSPISSPLLPRAWVRGMPWLIDQGEDLICK